MSSLKVAVPIDSELGLDSPVSSHFGHSHGFFVATIADGEITETQTLRNHSHTSCAGPVELLAQNGVRILITRGIGMRPLVFSQQMGISVLTAQGLTVREAVENYLKGNSSQLGVDQTCRGSGVHH